MLQKDIFLCVKDKLFYCPLHALLTLQKYFSLYQVFSSKLFSMLDRL